MDGLVIHERQRTQLNIIKIRSIHHSLPTKLLTLAVPLFSRPPSTTNKKLQSSTTLSVHLTFSSPSDPIMEPDVSIETSSMIRIAILPIGEIPHQTLRDYYSIFHHHHPIPLSSISSFYTEEQKSPFTSLPWDTGSLRFKFILGGSPPSPWEDFQSNRKILAVIGVFHCPLSPDLDSVIEEFDGVCKI